MGYYYFTFAENWNDYNIVYIIKTICNVAIVCFFLQLYELIINICTVNLVFSLYNLFMKRACKQPFVKEDEHKKLFIFNFASLRKRHICLFFNIKERSTFN